MPNGTDIAKAYVQIIPSAEGIKGKLTEVLGGEADSAGKNAGGRFSKIFGGVAKAGVAAAGVATAMTGALVSQTNAVAQYGDNIDKMSQKMGMSATAYQEWDAIMQHSGTSMETMKAGMKTLANAVESGNEAFQRIGLTQEQIASMSQEDLFAATIAGLQNVENETERTYLAGKLLGRGATELGALLNTSAEDTEAMRQRVHELGGVMSDEAVKAAAHYKDSLQDMMTAFTGLKNNLLSGLLPSLTTVMDGLGNLFSGNGGLDQIKEGINGLVAQVSEALPKIMTVGGEILNALVSAIVENLPTLLEAGTDLIVTLAVGVVNAIPTLIAKAPEIIMALLRALISAAPKLLEASAQIITTIANGIGNLLGRVVQKGREILNSVKQGILGAISSLAEVGMNIVRGIWQGISNGLGWIKGKIQGWVGNVMSFIKNLFGIHSPSSVMRDEVGRFLALGIGEGFADEMTSVEKEMQGAMPDLSASYSVSGSRYAPSNGEMGLTAQVAALRDELRNMKIYLDTGILVGAVDEGLQTRAMTQARRALA